MLSRPRPVIVRGLLACLWFCLAALAVHADISPRSLVEPALPSWIEPPLALPAPPPVDPSTSVRMLVMERQIDVARGAEFCHCALRVETEAGLQAAGQVAVTFASTYQKLHWHYLRVWRHGRCREVLRPDEIQVLRQERGGPRGQAAHARPHDPGREGERRPALRPG